MMLQNPDNHAFIRWCPDGHSFITTNTEEFANHVLSAIFNHSNFNSFVRQLHSYDFHKTVLGPDTFLWRHKHGFFSRGLSPEEMKQFPRKRKSETTQRIEKLEALVQKLTTEKEQLISENRRLKQSLHQLRIYKTEKSSEAQPSSRHPFDFDSDELASMTSEMPAPFMTSTSIQDLEFNDAQLPFID